VVMYCSLKDLIQTKGSLQTSGKSLQHPTVLHHIDSPLHKRVNGFAYVSNKRKPEVSTMFVREDI
jgi:hypothetical protein